MNKATVITSDTLLDDLNHHFRVFAGPGAGKTYWLVKHIENVVQNSQRLSPHTRVACISYTNVAVNTIVKQLGQSADRVDVSTIHSFLYRAVVKPYLHFLKDERGEHLVRYELVDGHDEHRPTYSKVEAWLKTTAMKNPTWLLAKERAELFDYLKNLVWQLDDESQEWTLVGRKPVGGAKGR